MPGEAIVTIRDKQWQVSVADTPWELMQGLGGMPEVPAGAGMFFDSGVLQIIEVTTIPMLFPIDIAFLSETAVVTEVYREIEPGYMVTSTMPARYFLEVNAGELEDIQPGDRAAVEFLPLEEIPVVETDWMSAMVGFMGFAVMAVFVTAIARDFVKAALEPSKRKPVLYGPRGERLLPQTVDVWETRAVVLEDTLTGIPGFQDKLSSVEDWLTNVERELFPTRDLIRRTVERFPDRFGITRDNVIYVKFAQFPQAKAGEKKPTRDDVEVDSWAERDRIGIWVVDLRTDETIAEWWDEKAKEMFDQGFFKPAAWIKNQTLWGKEFRESVLDYLEDTSVLAKAGLQTQTERQLVRVTRPADSWFRPGQIVTRQEFEKAVAWVKERSGESPLGEPVKGEPAELAARILRGLQGSGEAYRAYVKYPPDKSAFVIIGSIIGGHYSWNPQGFSVWVSSWKVDPEWPRDSILRIRELKTARAYEATEEGVRKALDYVKSEFPTFTRSTWVSKSIPVYVAQELDILELERLPQTKARHDREQRGRFKIEHDRMGNIIITHTERQGNIFLQFEADREIVYDVLKKSERQELDKGWTIEIKDTEPRASILQELGEAAGPGSLPSVRVMPKLPPEAYKDILFCEYIRDLVKLGETITDEEARLMWEAWKKKEPQRLPSVAPREGEYSWLIIDPETGEIMIKTGYATTSKAKRAARNFALRRARYAGEHPVKIRIYDRDPDIGNLETGVVFQGRILIPQGTVEQASPGEDKFKPGEIVRYKGERVRVSEQIGDRVNVFIPSRQELVWVKPEALERIEGNQPAAIPAEPTGTCYVDAWRFVIKEEEGALVHGTVFSGGRRIGHAWVETSTGWVWEPETERYFTELGFRDAFSPDIESRYTAEEAAIMAARTKHFGPWTEQERRQYLKEKSPAVIPTKPRHPRSGKEEMEYLPDSPEVLAQTIDAIGYRERIDAAFQEAIKRAKGQK